MESKMEEPGIFSYDLHWNLNWEGEDPSQEVLDKFLDEFVDLCEKYKVEQHGGAFGPQKENVELYPEGFLEENKPL